MLIDAGKYDSAEKLITEGIEVASVAFDEDHYTNVELRAVYGLLLCTMKQNSQYVSEGVKYLQDYLNFMGGGLGEGQGQERLTDSDLTQKFQTAYFKYIEESGDAL